MILKKNILFLISVLLVILLTTGFSYDSPDHPKTGYWAMEGTLITHSFKQKTDSLSGPELYELQDEDRLPIWFGRLIFKDVCISGQCKMIRVWLFWDGAGNYLGLQVLENEPLTKSDHTEFEPEDYMKLETILKDTSSIMKGKVQEELVIKPLLLDSNEIDGYSAATQPGLADVVVKDAVYTCYTLWHTVYGPVQRKINEIIENRLDANYLDKMFTSSKQKYNEWAIDYVKRHPEFHEQFYPRILHLVGSEDELLARRALRYFNVDYLDDDKIQMELADAISYASPGTKNYILWMFIGHKSVDGQVVLKLLNLFDDEILGIGDFNLILKLITPELLENNEALDKSLHSYLTHENAYIRGLTERVLNK